jgi:hypothetical protein
LELRLSISSGLWRSAGTQDLRFQVAGIANRLGFADGMTLTVEGDIVSANSTRDE